MAKDNLKKFVAKDAAKFSDRVGAFYEEVLDIFFDQWDTFKKLDVKVQAAIGGGAALLVLVLVVILIAAGGPEEIPVIGGLDRTGILGENFIVIESESEEPLANLILVVDNAYIYRIEEMTPYQMKQVNLSQFHHLAGTLEEGATVEGEIKPKLLVLHLDDATKTIELVKMEKTFFQKLFGK